MINEVFSRLKTGEEVKFKLHHSYFDRTLYTVQFDPDPDGHTALVWWQEGPDKTQTEYPKEHVLGFFGGRQWVAV